MTYLTSTDHIACKECDLLLTPPSVQYGEKALCPRCGGVLEAPVRRSVERTLSLAVTGLILYFPAMFLPMLGVQILGEVVEVPLWRSFTALFDRGMWMVAVLVLLSSIIFPLIKLLLCLGVSLNLYFHQAPNYALDMMRWIHHMEEWAMLEVYTLGIIVAVVKLSGQAEMYFGLGLYSFLALMIITTMLSAAIDEEAFWKLLGRFQQKEQNSVKEKIEPRSHG